MQQATERGHVATNWATFRSREQSWACGHQKNGNLGPEILGNEFCQLPHGFTRGPRKGRNLADGSSAAL